MRLRFAVVPLTAEETLRLDLLRQDANLASYNTIRSKMNDGTRIFV
jgi:hypothetical protein